MDLLYLFLEQFDFLVVMFLLAQLGDLEYSSVLLQVIHLFILNAET